MSSTSDDVAAAQVESVVYSITLMRYLSVMGMVLVVYDFLLTLNDEVYLISCICFSYASQLVCRCASFGRGHFNGQKRCSTSIAMYPSLELYIPITVSGMPSLVGPSIETFYVLEFSDVRPPLSVLVSSFRSISSALIHTYIFKLSVSLVIFTSVLCA